MMLATNAFVMRDLKVAWSYRFSFFMQNASLIFSLISLRFVSDLLGESQPQSLSKYGGDYFSFVLIGMAVSLLAYPITKSFAGAVRANQVTGTFEAMLTTQTSGLTVVISSGLYPVLIATAQLVFMLVVGAIVLGASFSAGHLLLVAMVLAMTIAVLVGIGLLSAAFAIAFQQNEPLTAAFLAASLLASGIMYPTSVLPSWIAPLAPLLPLTHSVELARLLMLQGATMSQIGVHFAALAAFCGLLPLGILALKFSMAYARRSGTLSQY